MLSPIDLRRLAEDFAILNGTRAGRNQTGRAVRIADVQPALEFPRNPKSAPAAGAAPTKAEFDALVADVHAIYRQMAALSDALRERLA